MKDKNAVQYFSLALSESTDVSALSQFSNIAWYVAGDIREESRFPSERLEVFHGVFVGLPFPFSCI